MASTPIEATISLKTDRYGPYRLVREIGRGGMGIVYEASDETLQRRVALKILGPWLAGDSSAEERIQVEARALAQLRHPSVVQVLGAGRESGLFYFAMEYVEGETLDSLLAKGPVPAPRSMEIGAAVAGALGAAHGAGIIHRDLKPSNIILDPSGLPKVADFGLARALGSSRLTATGQVLGTPAYMAPEQVQGKPPTAATDVYSLGVVLFEMLAGVLPFQGDTPFTTALKHVQEAPPDIRGMNPDIPWGLGDLVMRCLSKKPEDRSHSQDLAMALRRMLEEYQALEKALGPLRTASAPVPPQGTGPSRMGTAWGVVWFADVEAFTPLTQAAAPELVGRLLGEFYRGVRSAVESERGHVVQFIGDCCFAVFLALDRREAVRRALQAAEMMHARMDGLGKLLSRPMRLRIGMHAGEFLAGPLHDGETFRFTAFGDTINWASRLEKLCSPGGVCATGAVVGLLPTGWRAGPVRRIPLKARAGEIEVYDLERGPTPEAGEAKAKE